MFDPNGWSAIYDGVRMANETLGDGARQAEVDNFGDAATSATWADHEASCCLLTARKTTRATSSTGAKSTRATASTPRSRISMQLNVAATTTPIYTVGLGPRADHAALSSLADATGGRHVAMDDPAPSRTCSACWPSTASLRIASAPSYPITCAARSTCASTTNSTMAATT